MSEHTRPFKCGLPPISMIRILTFVIFLLVADFSIAATHDRRPIERAVTTLVTNLSDGIAVNYPEFRFIRFGRLLGGETDDAVAYFSIEGFGGSNYHAEYLAIFASVPREHANGRTTRPYRLVAVSKIGGRGWRTLDWETTVLKPSSITVSGKRWLENDPGCCASKPFATTFHIKDDILVEGP
jgi:hypothetical protein